MLTKHDDLKGYIPRGSGKTAVSDVCHTQFQCCSDTAEQVEACTTGLSITYTAIR